MTRLAALHYCFDAPRDMFSLFTTVTWNDSPLLVVQQSGITTVSVPSSESIPQPQVRVRVRVVGAD
eukprot:scaffold792_cov268-Skeletonema_menzelii.AAC.1